MSDTILEKYLPVEALEKSTCNANYLKIELYYTLGGYSCFTYSVQPRGYYVSIIPMQRDFKNGYGTETYGLFDGGKHLLKECSRKSKKAQAEAEKEFDNCIDELIDFVCKKNNLQLIKD